MIETFPLDMLLSLGLGMSFSLGQGEKEKESKNIFTSTYFMVGLAFHFVVAIGVALLCYLLEPDWMLMYFTDRKRVPRSVVACVFGGYVAMYVLGFLSVPELRKLGRRAPWAAFASVLALVFAVIGLTFHRLWYVGDIDAYEAGTAAPITRTSLFPVLGVAMPSAVGGLAAVLLKLRARFDASATE